MSPSPANGNCGNVTQSACPKAPGVYEITCTANGRTYVGSAVNLYQRRHQHFTDLKRNVHFNRKLQRAWNKYGSVAFTFEIIELVLLKEMLTAREQYWMNELKPFYNVSPTAGSCLGVKHSPETRERMAAWQRGRPSPLRGVKHSPEAVERQRLALIGYKHSEEARRHMGDARRGKRHSAETREKMRRAALGHPPTHAKDFVLTSPSGEEFVVHGLYRFCAEHQISQGTINQVAKGKRRQHKGWKARYLTPQP